MSQNEKEIFIPVLKSYLYYTGRSKELTQQLYRLIHAYHAKHGDSPYDFFIADNDSREHNVNMTFMIKEAKHLLELTEQK